MAIIVGRRDASPLISTAAPVHVPDKTPTEEFAQGVKAVSAAWDLGGKVIDTATKIAGKASDVVSGMQRKSAEESAQEEVKKREEERKKLQAQLDMARSGRRSSVFVAAEEADKAGDWKKAAKLYGQAIRDPDLPLDAYSEANARYNDVAARAGQKVVAYGSRGAEVGKIQQFLIDQGYAIEKDDVWGDKTQNAIDAWKKTKSNINVAPSELKAIGAESGSDEAVKAFNAGAYGRAGTLFMKAYKESGKAIPLYNAARAAEMAGQTDRAIELFEQYEKVETGMGKSLAREKVLELSMKKLPKLNARDIVEKKMGITYQEAQVRMAELRMEPDLAKRSAGGMEVIRLFNKSGGEGTPFRSFNDYLTGGHLLEANRNLSKGITPAPLAMMKQNMAQKKLNASLMLSKARMSELSQRMKIARSKEERAELQLLMKQEMQEQDILLKKAYAYRARAAGNLSGTRRSAITGKGGGVSLKELRKRMNNLEDKRAREISNINKANAMLDASSEAQNSWVMKNDDGTYSFKAQVKERKKRQKSPPADIKRAVATVNAAKKNIAEHDSKIAEIRARIDLINQSGD